MGCDGTPDKIGVNPNLQLFWEPGIRGLGLPTDVKQEKTLEGIEDNLRDALGLKQRS